MKSYKFELVNKAGNIAQLEVCAKDAKQALTDLSIGLKTVEEFSAYRPENIVFLRQRGASSKRRYFHAVKIDSAGNLRFSGYVLRKYVGNVVNDVWLRLYIYTRCANFNTQAGFFFEPFKEVNF